MLYNGSLTHHVYIACNSYITHNLNKARVISRKDVARAFLFYMALLFKPLYTLVMFLKIIDTISLIHVML